MSQVTPFILYSSVGCHLCEIAWQQCQQLNVEQQVTVVDIVDHPDTESLVAKYGISIPVLKRTSDQQELFWPFDIEQLQEFIF